MVTNNTQHRKSHFLNCSMGSILFFFIVSLFSYSPSFAQASGGGYSEAYLLRDVGARAISMAGAFTAISNDPNAIFYNPAGLGFLANKPQITGSVSSLGHGRTHSTMAWAQSIYPRLGVGFGVNSFSTGSFTGRDVMGNPIGDFSALQYALNLAGAYSLENAAIGFNVKYLTNNLTGASTNATGYGLDVGTKFDVMNMVSVGVAVQNISGIMFWNNANGDYEYLPYTVRAGIAMEYGLNDEKYQTRSSIDGEIEEIYVPPTRYLIFSFDAILRQYEESPSFIIGTEIVFHEFLAFRAGFDIYGDDKGQSKFLPLNNWGTGVSIRPDANDLHIPFSFHIDYSVANSSLTDNNLSHNISFYIEF